jgi:hypothetical protein
MCLWSLIIRSINDLKKARAVERDAKNGSQSRPFLPPFHAVICLLTLRVNAGCHPAIVPRLGDHLILEECVR